MNVTLLQIKSKSLGYFTFYFFIYFKMNQITSVTCNNVTFFNVWIFVSSPHVSDDKPIMRLRFYEIWIIINVTLLQIKSKSLRYFTFYLIEIQCTHLMLPMEWIPLGGVQKDGRGRSMQFKRQNYKIGHAVRCQHVRWHKSSDSS